MNAPVAIPTAPPTRITVRDRLRTVYIDATLVLGLLVYLGLFGPFLWLAGKTFDRRRCLARRIARGIFPRLLRHYCRNTGFPLQCVMPEIPWKTLGPCIVVANHSSSMDVLMLMQLPLPVGAGRVWAKGWPFKKPLLGWLMRLSGHLFVEDFNLLPDAQECLADGESLLVFPESTRSRTGRLSRFRDGAFLLAARTGRPIIPVAIHGTFASFPPGQPIIFPPIVRLEVLGVLSVKGNDPREHIELKRQAHDMIRGALEGQRKADANAVAA